MADTQNAESENAEAAARFAERFALLLVEAGVPRMPARVFGALLLDEDGRSTASDLATQLRVSPAAISGAVRYLQQVGLIHRARQPGERRDHYEVTDDLWYEAYANRDKQLEQWAMLMGDGVAVVGENSRAGARLAESRRFFEFLRGEIHGMMERWRGYQREHR
ncbi:MarR family transcriptional regulator [Actinophytocola xinjiangensis]|uniref:MarR family transcriptional regulator n=1 Tax=Actinophytocola xinjiangensis TaxID=485602 RepID=A0A7Z0WHS9_9PSEU|nr:MarR family transcriptional regulator [Actinophytocola xinjiangensis]OLF07508.1 MarR family transcriptional regulator [Actinophytocola xinjiangensis]